MHRSARSIKVNRRSSLEAFQFPKRRLEKKGVRIIDAPGLHLEGLARKVASALLQTKQRRTAGRISSEQIVVVSAASIESLAKGLARSAADIDGTTPASQRSSSFGFPSKTISPNEILKEAVEGLLPKTRRGRAAIMRLQISSAQKNNASMKSNKSFGAGMDAKYMVGSNTMKKSDKKEAGDLVVAIREMFAAAAVQTQASLLKLKVEIGAQSDGALAALEERLSERSEKALSETEVRLVESSNKALEDFGDRLSNRLHEDFEALREDLSGKINETNTKLEITNQLLRELVNQGPK